MKAFTGTIIFISTILVFGCTRVVYTHQQVVDRYKTKQDVSNRFGQAVERITLNGTEQWLYNLDPSTANMSTTDVTQFSRFKRYIIFTFDAQGNVVKSESHGVDLAERRPDTGKTIGLVAGVVALVVAIVAVATIHVNPGISFGG
ncbi:MAG TPA: hypothetical protein VHE59_17925 [Mucilaginibacter sp.]|nr:hypothetical protein [Mucilaginibacter sp.]